MTADNGSFVKRSGVISNDGRYRYSLTRKWVDGPRMCWIIAEEVEAVSDMDPMLNPLKPYERLRQDALKSQHLLPIPTSHNLQTRRSDAYAGIKSFGSWANNAEMLADVARLGYLPEPCLDLTHNAGKFWRDYQPGRLITNDLDPQWHTGYNEDCRATRFADGEFATVVFDPPYKLSGTNVLGKFDRQYGTTTTRSRVAVLALLVGGIAEAARLAREFVLVKCQDQVNGGAVRWQTTAAVDTARTMELVQVDEFWLDGGGPPQDPERGQQHARHDRSTLLVFGTQGANNRRKKLMATT